MRTRKVKLLHILAIGVSCIACSANIARVVAADSREESAEATLSSNPADLAKKVTGNTSNFFTKSTSFLEPVASDTSAAAQSQAQPTASSDFLRQDPAACCDDLVPGCNMCPCTYGWLEGLLLWRNNSASNQVLVSNLNSSRTLLTVGGLNFNAGGGIRAGFGVRDNCGVAWELNYFGIFNQNASATVNGNNDLLIPGALGQQVNNFFGADVVNVTYASQLNNFEINRVCCCCCCDCQTRCRSVEWLYGFRYLNLGEQFNLTATDLQESSSTYRIRTYNNLVGGQIGTRLRRCFGGWSLEGTGKAGVFGNIAQQQSDAITDFPNQFLIRPATSANGGSVAFVGDLNFSAIYQIDRNWGLRAGYNLIWIQGVALAPNQLDFTNTPTSGTNLNTSGGVFLQGLSAGIEARW